MTDPLFWLVLSLLFVTISLTIVLVVAIPTLRELSRASRSAEKLFDTLRREFPPTLQAIRLTGLEISDLTEDVSEGVQSAGQVVKQVDQSLSGVRQQAQRVQYSTRSVVVGLRAAWRTFNRSSKAATQRRSVDRLPTTRPEAIFNSPSDDSYESGPSHSEHPNETVAETTHTNARRGVSPEETLSQPVLNTNPDLASRGLGDSGSRENEPSLPTSRNVERARAALSNQPKQPDPNTAISDPSNRHHEAETIDYQD